MGTDSCEGSEISCIICLFRVVILGLAMTVVVGVVVIVGWVSSVVDGVVVIVG